MDIKEKLNLIALHAEIQRTGELEAEQAMSPNIGPLMAAGHSGCASLCTRWAGKLKEIIGGTPGNPSLKELIEAREAVWVRPWTKGGVGWFRLYDAVNELISVKFHP